MSVATWFSYTAPIATIYLFIYYQFSQKDRGHTKGENVLSAPPYTHTYIHTHIQLQGHDTKNKQKL